MNTAIQFGAGNIGRGFIGMLLAQAGYKVVFADVNEALISRLHQDKAYTVHIMDVNKKDVRIDGVDWGDGNTVKLVVGIASTGNEHIEVLGRIAEVCETEEAVDNILTMSVDEVYDLFKR